MSRRSNIKHQLAKLDPIYNNRLLTKLINKVMKSGKKSVAEKEVYQAMKNIEEKTKSEPIKLFELAIQNVAPRMEVRPRRVGGASYQIPIEVKGNRKSHLAMKWIIEAARKRSNKEYHHFSLKLAAELIDASKNVGEAIKKRDSTQKMADANRAFAHFRW